MAEVLKPQEDFGLPLLRQFALLLAGLPAILFGNPHEF
jgi:hypothetical protein